MLFEEQINKIEENNISNKFLVDFFWDPEIWDKKDYFKKLGYSDDWEIAISTFAKRVKYYNDKYVNSNKMPKSELRNILAIIIEEQLPLSHKNIKKIQNHIKMGFYRNYLNKINKKIEFAKLDDSVWEGLFD